MEFAPLVPVISQTVINATPPYVKVVVTVKSLLAIANLAWPLVPPLNIIKMEFAQLARPISPTVTPVTLHNAKDAPTVSLLLAI